jgi:hypothetical protein
VSGGYDVRHRKDGTSLRAGEATEPAPPAQSERSVVSPVAAEGSARSPFRVPDSVEAMRRITRHWRNKAMSPAANAAAVMAEVDALIAEGVLVELTEPEQPIDRREIRRRVEHASTADTNASQESSGSVGPTGHEQLRFVA